MRPLKFFESRNKKLEFREPKFVLLFYCSTVVTWWQCVCYFGYVSLTTLMGGGGGGDSHPSLEVVFVFVSCGARRHIVKGKLNLNYNLIIANHTF